MGENTLFYSDLNKKTQEAIDAVNATNNPAFIVNKDSLQKTVLLNHLIYEKMVACMPLEEEQTRLEELEKAYVRFLLLIASLIDTHESYLVGHAERVAMLSCAVAEELGMSEKLVEEVRIAALLHDIGEIIVPTDILQKPGKLTPEEIEIIHQHPRIGAELLAPIKNYTGIAEIIHSHQEKYNGSGYPRGLKGEEIPLGARIVSVVSTYDALTNIRLHRETGNHDFAFDEIRRCNGTDFDPTIVEAFYNIF
jgi:putative nucleotidyltransferase with HDIG domain